MNVFVSGGCKNGKSMYAQNLAKFMSTDQNRCLYYLATMKPTDEDDLARIAKHIEERKGLGFITLEQSKDICCCLEERDEEPKKEFEKKPDLNTTEEPEKEPEKKTDLYAAADPEGVFLLDSVTALLSNEMFGEDGTVDYEAPSRVAEQLKQFAISTGNTVFVSDYIYSDASEYEELTEAYRKGLAMIDRTLATICEQVIEVNYGSIINHKKLI